MEKMFKKLAVVLSVIVVCAPMGAMAANKLIVQDSAGTTDKMVVTDTGYIGVGTTAPIVPLHLVGANINDTKIISHYQGTTASGGGNILMFHNNAAGALPVQYDRLGNIMFGSVVNGTTQIAGAGISAYADGAWTASSFPTSISFQTTPAVGPRAERIKVLGNGNVGIGSSNPTVKLQVDNGVRLTSSIAKPTCAANVGGTMWFTSTAAGSKDLLELCAKDANGNYGWRLIY
jgi:hypothetical protein